MKYTSEEIENIKNSVKEARYLMDYYKDMAANYMSIQNSRIEVLEEKIDRLIVSFTKSTRLEEVRDLLAHDEIKNIKDRVETIEYASNMIGSNTEISYIKIIRRIGEKFRKTIKAIKGISKKV